MNYDTLLMLKNDVNIDINNNSTRIYQSIRVLSEYVIKVFLDKIGDEYLTANSKPSMGQLFEHLKSRYRIEFDIENFLISIIKIRNKREHDPDNAPKTVGHLQIKTMILCYNDLIKSLDKILGQELDEFYFNEDIFYSSFSVKAAHRPDNTVEEMYAKMEVKRLREKLTLLEKELKTSSDLNQYKIRSEIIATKNNIKSNDKRILSIYSSMDTYIRKPMYLNYEEFINVGLGSNDYGFTINGLNSNANCTHHMRNIYAVVYGLLRRSTIYKPSQFLLEYEKKNGIKLNFYKIIRFQFIYLILIKKNVIVEFLDINILNGDDKEFVLAFNDVNNYANIIADMSNIKFKPPCLKIGKNGINLSIGYTSDADIWSEDLLIKNESMSSLVWHENDILYKINDSNKMGIHILLKDLFGLDDYKEGQENIIINFLNNKSSGICVMPTSGGKSLIYYFVSLLSSLPLIIVEPTYLLIMDQIRNLKESHNIVDCVFLQEDCDYSKYNLNSKLNYVLPEIFMNYTFINRISQFHNQNKLNKIILDEVHCASNWSHDYRPAYLMLSKYITSYLPSVQILGFTATTSILISQDIIAQFQIERERVYEAAKLKREDILIDVISFDKDEAIYNELYNQINTNSSRMLIFTKNKQISSKIYRNLSNEIKIKCDVYADEKLDSYQDFVLGFTDALITDSDMSIGLNIPMVNRSYHIGYPYSRNHFIQEAGRIARNHGNGSATILVKNIKDLETSEKRLLDLSVSIGEIVERINSLKNSSSDIYQTYLAIMGHVEVPKICAANTKEVYAELLSQESGADGIILFCYRFDNTEERISSSQVHMQVYLMILYNLGIVYEWFIEGESDKGVYYRVNINPDSKNISIIKSNLMNFLRNMNCDNSTILKIKRSNNVDDLITTYIDWYYYSYLNYHREQFINMVQMVSSIYNNRNILEKSDLGQNFSLALEQVDDIKKTVFSKSITELIINIDFLSTPGMETLMQKCLEGIYNIKFDIVLLCIDALNNNEFYYNRFKRIIKSAGDHVLQELNANIIYILNYCKDDNKLLMLDYVCGDNETTRKLFEIYEDKPRDGAFYTILIKIINNKLKGDLKYE